MIGFEDEAPLQVWDIATGTKVREFEGKVRECRSLITLPSGRVVVGCRRVERGGAYVIAVYDGQLGKQLQEWSVSPTGHGGEIDDVAYVDGHLLSTSGDQLLRVWSASAKGKVRATTPLNSPMHSR